jgi:hypothetical protein
MTESSPQPAAPFTLPQARVEDVFQATEEVRAAELPAVPADLLAAVLAAERDNPDSRQAAARAVGRVIDSYLADHPREPASEPASGPADAGSATSGGATS